MLRFLFLCLLALSATTPLTSETFRNPRQIPVISPGLIGTADFNGDGRPDFYYFSQYVSYTNPQISLVFAQPNGTYTSPPTISLPVGMGRCRAADLNGDGRADLFCLSRVDVVPAIADTFLGNGDGTFQSPRSVTIPGRQTAYAHSFAFSAIGDVNHDGHADVVLFDFGAGTLFAFLGDGTGNFPRVQTSVGHYLYPYSYGGNSRLTDINGDGNLDLLPPAGPDVFFGNGDGTFTFQQNNSPLPGCAYADVDNDGHLDAICASPRATPPTGSSGPNGYDLIVLHGNPDGTFVQAPIYQAPFPYYDLFAPFDARDLNGDGLLDIVASSGDGLAVYLGKPGLQFAPPVHYAFYNVGGFNTDQADPSLVADYNQDGHIDLAMPGANGIYIAYGRPDGTFDAPPIVQSGTNIGFAVVSDFNEDGVPDVITSGSGIPQLDIGNGDGTFAPFVPIATSTTPNYYNGVGYSLLAGDFNGDSHPDVLATSPQNGGQTLTQIFFNRGGGSFAAPASVSSNFNYVPVGHTTAVADINHDGRDDLVAVTGGAVANTSQLSVYFSNGDGSFTVQSTPIPQGTFSYYNSAPAAADFNGDGKPDLALASNDQVQILLGKGDGNFTLASPVAVPNVDGNHSTFIPAAVSGDFDHDGKQDFAILATGASYLGDDNDPGPTAIIVFYGNGDGTFSTPTTAATLNHGYLNFATGDFNRDGIADFAASTNSAYGVDDDYNGDAIAVVHGLPNRTFGPETNLVAGNGLSSLAIADFNRDGFPDLLFANGEYTGNAFANSFVVLLNQPIPTVTGTLTASPKPSAIQQPFTLTASLYPPPPPSAATLGGTVNFFLDGASLGSSPVTTNSATFNLNSQIARGDHTLTAVWSGDTNYPSVSLNATQTVTGYPVSLPFTTSSNPVFVNQPFSLQYSVSNAASVPAGIPQPLGTFTLTDNGSNVFAPLTVSGGLSGAVTFGNGLAPAGKHTFVVSYSGDSVHEPASATIIVNVIPTTSSTVALTSPNPSVYGKPITVSATITIPTGNPQGQLLPPPQPTVTFTGFPGGPVTTPAALNTSQSTTTSTVLTASYTANSVPAGTYNITATYSGNMNTESSVSSPVTHVVQSAATTTTLTASPATAYERQAINLSATVPGVLPTAAGSIRFFDGPTPLGTVALASGAATLTSQLSVGVHALTAVYSGDSNNLTSTSSTVTVTILPSDFNLSLDPSSLSIVTGHHTTLHLTATGTGIFADTVRLSASNLPQWVTVQFKPVDLKLTAGGTATTSVYVDTDAVIGYMSQANPRPSRTPGIPVAAAAFALILAPITLRRRRRIASLLALTLAAALLAVASGCSGKYPDSTVPGVYTLKITATAAQTGLTHTINLPLTVTQ